jgi:hypothetical protein
MCFSAEASAAAAVALLPVGGYCLATAWRKDRAYLLFAAVPLLFGLQQVSEAYVWRALDRGDAEAARIPSLAFLFFALAAWPVWIPLAVAAVEPWGWRRGGALALAGAGALFAATHYLPLASGSGGALSPSVVGHSLRYDLSGLPVFDSDWWWAWVGLYLGAVCTPLLASRDRRLRPLGVAAALAAAITYLLFEYAFASVWCFFAAVLSLYLAYVLYRLPEPPGLAPAQVAA